MAQNTDEMAAIVIRDDCDECVTRTPANSHHRQKSPGAVVRSPCRREKHACRRWKRYRRRDGKSARAPFVKKNKNDIQLAMSELALQVSRSSPSCDSKREVCSDHRSCGCNCRVLVPRIAVGGGENCRQDVGASKGWQGRAIENREEEEPHWPQVAEHRGKAVSLRRSGILDGDVQHERNISTLLTAMRTRSNERCQRIGAAQGLIGLGLV